MKTYLIDGNNLIGKIKTLKSIQLKDKQASREKLAFMIDKYFTDKNVKIFLFFDGYENISIPSAKSKIVYSRSKTADELIKLQIEHSKNARQIVLVSSDSNLVQFASVCRCEVVKSEKFTADLSTSKNINVEENINKSIDINEMKRLFGI